MKLINNIQAIFSAFKCHQSSSIPIKLCLKDQSSNIQRSIVPRWVAVHPPFERIPDWRGWLAMLSSQIILSRKWVASGLEQDSNLKLRSGLLREFKSMSAALQQLSAGPGRRNKARPWQTNSNLVDGPVSSGFQLAALDFAFRKIRTKKSAPGCAWQPVGLTGL
ncbi:hypothetical protein [Lactiplantibacillus pentosus]|uniref:hypothetical protein n=1 Tax=Lactiplantibacillus pentosus TaxID=1589 RepID=UPI0021A79FC7|nr:hypothetical protein [Lactiplantibacillus pentosus]